MKKYIKWAAPMVTCGILLAAVLMYYIKHHTGDRAVGVMKQPNGGGSVNAANQPTGDNTTDATNQLTMVSFMDVMCQPAGAVVMEDGSFLVTDIYNKMIWRVKDGVSTVYAGHETVEDLHGQPIGGYNDGKLEDSYFKKPWAIAPFLDGWAVSDTENNAVRLLRSEGTETVNGHSSENLTTTELGVAFQNPTGLAADEDGNLYVSDTFANAIRKITAQGEITTVASNILEPMGLCWHDGVLYIAESGANRILKLEGSKVTVVAGSGEAGYKDGSAAQATFSGPQGVAVGKDGTVYVSDTDNSAIRRIKNGQVTTLVVRDMADLSLFFPISPSNLLIYKDTLYICDPFACKLLAYSLGEAE